MVATYLFSLGLTGRACLCGRSSVQSRARGGWRPASEVAVSRAAISLALAPLPHAPFCPPVPHSICPLQVLPVLHAQPVPQCLRGRREEVQETMEQREEGDAPAPGTGRVVRRAGSRTIATFRVRDLMGWRPATSPIQRSISCFRRIQRFAS